MMQAQRRVRPPFSLSALRLLVLGAMVAALLPGCGGDQAQPLPTATLPEPTATATPAPPTPDYWPTNGWRTSTPEEQGIDSQQLLVALQHAEDAKINIRSMTVIRNGYIVLEAYNQPFTPTRQYPVFSVTKSVTGALIGIAVQEGLIKSIKEPVLSFFPGKQIANLDKNKEAITVEDLISLQPGIDCADDKLGNKVEMSPDWVQYTLDLPMETAPGTKLVYCTAGIHLLSAILTKATGMTEQEYAQSRLFDPLGIRKEDISWGADPQGNTTGGYGLNIQPRDMAKLGLLYQYGGKWNGTQVVPEQWVAESTRVHAKGGDNKDYGYGMWVYPSHFAAEGNGEQKIQVVKDRNLLVVMTAAIDWHKGQVLEDLLRDYIIPAAKSDKPLPPNAAALAALQAKVDWMANPVSEVPPLPEIAHIVSNKTFLVGESPFGWKAIKIEFTDGSPMAIAFLQTNDGDMQAEIGLDNVYRVVPDVGNTPIALRGRWQDNDTFVVTQVSLPTVQEVQFTFDFAGGQLKAQARETVFDSFDIDVQGTPQK